MTRLLIALVVCTLGLRLLGKARRSSDLSAHGPDDRDWLDERPLVGTGSGVIGLDWTDPRGCWPEHRVEDCSHYHAPDVPHEPAGRPQAAEEAWDEAEADPGFTDRLDAAIGRMDRGEGIPYVPRTVGSRPTLPLDRGTSSLLREWDAIDRRQGE